MIFFKTEFTVDAGEQGSSRFREDLLKLMSDYRASLVGFMAEDLVSKKILCEDGGLAEAETVLATVFGDHEAGPDPQA